VKSGSRRKGVDTRNPTASFKEKKRGCNTLTKAVGPGEKPREKGRNEKRINGITAPSYFPEICIENKK